MELFTGIVSVIITIIEMNKSDLSVSEKTIKGKKRGTVQSDCSSFFIYSSSKYLIIP